MLLVLLGPTASAQTGYTYTVKPGDTLYRIAVNHGMSVTQLRTLNGLEDELIKSGQLLQVSGPMRVPASDSLEVAVRSDSVAVPGQIELVTASDSLEVGVPSDSSAVLGQIRAPESRSLYDLAFRLGVPVDTLEALNPDHATVLADGGMITVPAQFAASTYTVKSGDTLYGIAADHGIRISQLLASNPGLDGDIQAGASVRIPALAVAEVARLPLVVAEGMAAVFPDQFAGRLMASGRTYDPAAYLIAHPTIPLGTIVLIQNPASGRETFAEVADRMPVSEGRVIEVSRAVADLLELTETSVRMRIIHAADHQ